MTDIVERLRAYAGDDHERGCQGRYYDCSCGYDDKRDPLLTQAADEIEQLRAALEEIADFDTYEDISNDECMRDIARAALGGE